MLRASRQLEEARRAVVFTVLPTKEIYIAAILDSSSIYSQILCLAGFFLFEQLPVCEVWLNVVNTARA